MADDACIVLVSGPLSTHRQAEDCLQTRGLAVLDHDPRRHSFGYPATVDGDDDPTVGFIPVRATHPDDVAELVGYEDKPGPLAALGWQVRGHWPEPPPQSPIEVVPAGTLDRLDRLEALLSAKGVI